MPFRRREHALAGTQIPALHENYKENPMKKNKLPLLMNILLLFSLTITACSGIGIATPTLEAGTGTAEPASDIVTAEGKLLPAPAVELAFAQGGVIDEVLVKPGDKVAAGDVIARLAGAKTVEADLAAALAQYDQTYNAAMAQDQANRSKDLYKSQSGTFTLPEWYYSQPEQIGAAQAAADEAKETLTKAQERLNDIMQTTGAAFVKAEIDLATAQAAYDVAKNLRDRIKNGKDIDELTRRQVYLLQRDAYLQSKGVDPKWVTVTNLDRDLRDEAQRIFDDAESSLEDAQDAYDDAVSTDGAQDVQKARAQLSVDQEHYYTALDYVRSLQTGPESQTVITAQTAVDKAKAALDLYELHAPFDGTILSIDLKIGEAAAPALPVVFLADTTTWTVETKDLTEIDIARVALGQSVTVKLDALPGEEFSGNVTAIDPVGKEHLGDMTYKVTIALDKVDPRFLWNMTATVNIAVK
jgi:multidrug efflux pump subunit AcrA (membrane-fusion protein)